MTPISIKHKTFTLLAFVVIGFLIYSNTFDVPFHFDDSHVVSDLTFEEMLIRCKAGSSRVVAHLTFLFNYWMDSTDVFGYHLFNTLVHIGTAYLVYLFLYQILSLDNRLERFERFEQFNRYAVQPNQPALNLLPPLRDPLFWPPFWGGLLFLVHPLATQSVTYITQRYTSLAGFFYIGSIVFFISARQEHKHGERFLNRVHLVRYACSFVMAVLAMRTKELAVTLPAAVLLTEYSFIQSDFREACKRILYLLPLLSTALIIPASNMLGVETISLESLTAIQDYTWGPEITRTEYLLTQFKVIIGIYLKLIFWPIGQNIDHDYVISKTLLDPPTMASFLALCLFLGIGLWLFKRTRIAFFGILWFFVTISPTSSLVPNNEFVAEHRVYISLMGLAFAVAGLPKWQHLWKRYMLLLLPIVLLFSGLSYARNKVWQTDLSLWEDSVANSENRARPLNNLAIALAHRGRLDEAIGRYSEALKIEPGYSRIHYNLGVALVRHGKLNEAISHYSSALLIDPDYTDAHYNLALALSDARMQADAVRHFSEAVHIKSDHADAHYNLGLILWNQGKIKDAVLHYSMALQVRPNFSDAHNNLGVALAHEGKLQEATTHYSKALQVKPEFADAHNNLGDALANLGKVEEAIRHYFEALRIQPDFAEAHNNLGNAYIRQERFVDAAEHFSRALAIKPDFAKAHNNLGVAMANQGNRSEAIYHFSEALRLEPSYVDAQRNMEILSRSFRTSSEAPGPE